MRTTMSVVLAAICSVSYICKYHFIFVMASTNMKFLGDTFRFQSSGPSPMAANP